MKLGLLVILGLLAALVISGCVQESPGSADDNGNIITCDPPYRAIGNRCCLDQDRNGVCDSEAGAGGDTTTAGGQDAGSGFQLRPCPGQDVLVVTGSDCTISKFRALPIINFRSASEGIYLLVYYINETGENLVTVNTDIQEGRDYSIPIMPVTESGLHKFMLLDNRTGKCVYASVDCRG